MSGDLIGSRPLNWAERRAIVLDRAGYECAICGATATEADHKWPRVSGGTDDFDNLQALCRSCNAAKGDSLRFEHMTPNNLTATAALRLDAAVLKAIAAARFMAMAVAMGDGASLDEVRLIAEPGLDSIPAEWRSWIAAHIAEALGVHSVVEVEA